jgi:hypothetical protein
MTDFLLDFKNPRHCTSFCRSAYEITVPAPWELAGVSFGFTQKNRGQGLAHVG